MQIVEENGEELLEAVEDDEIADAVQHRYGTRDGGRGGVILRPRA